MCEPTKVAELVPGRWEFLILYYTAMKKLIIYHLGPDKYITNI
jgi:hypothetical protein